MVAKIGLERGAPIGCDPTDRALTSRIDPENQLRVGRQWPIAAELQVEQVVQEAVAAEADDLLRVHLIDESAGSRGRRQSGADIGKAPGGYRVPDVLHCRIIV